MPDFLLEIGVEEIPDWMIDPALADLRARFERLIAKQALRGSVHCTHATPRRLILHAQNLRAKQADSEELITGPPKSAGAGAAQGFARKNATTVDALETVTTGKGEYFSFRRRVKGGETLQILAEALPVMIPSIYFPKTMYWTGKGGVRFIRPIRWIVALLDNDVIPFEVAGVRSGNATRGHRVLGAEGPQPMTISSYQLVLAENGVIVRAVDRRARIEAALGADVQPDPELLQTLVYLTEFPTVIRGRFDPSYLELPKEILSTVMRHHQRYFSVLAPDGSLAPEFVAVTNTDGDPDGLIRQGNERVLRARFNDARFFWAVDQQRKLSERVNDLEKVTFQAKLGSYYDKTLRVRDLAARLAAELGADEGIVSRAATLSKCDLTTEMVKEFTELQGVVGGLYAVAQGEGDAVGAAIYDHYKPTNMDDSIPRTLEGQALSIADKFDTLRECFRIGMIPTGSKDPFALRRAAQGIVKILFEAKLPLGIFELTGDLADLEGFLRERVQFYLKEVRGYAYDEVNAVMAVPMTTLADLADRAEAIHKVRPTPDFEPLAASFKRIKNILIKASEAGQTIPAEPDESMLPFGGPERQLFTQLKRVKQWSSYVAEKDYESRLREMAQLRGPVDLFFDKILVNDPEEATRTNRLALLGSLLTEFSSIADFSEIVTASA
ncbi:MAG TPA: glycine--tRNA ligase subunit beta [Bryobacteraceae bacterium]|jgi:glycyl-tRNA synthetase beta chain|nr:glycine--tRNA ligase subunit beta [Bryobacteraceae bacterium]